MKKKNFSIPAFIISVFACVIAGSVGSIVTIPAIPTWYAGLVKPSFNPPNWLFGPVWTILFALMGIAVYFVWREGLRKRQVKIALGVFLFQFILNISWSFAFFGAKSPIFGLYVIIPLLMSIIGTSFLFYRISKVSGLLFVPYVMWVSFATILNIAIYVLN